MHALTVACLEIVDLLNHADEIDGRALAQTLADFAGADSPQLQMLLAGMQAPPAPAQVVEHSIGVNVVIGGYSGFPEWEGNQFPSHHHLVASIGRDYLSMTGTGAGWLYRVPWTDVLDLLKWVRPEVLREGAQLDREAEALPGTNSNGIDKALLLFPELVKACRIQPSDVGAFRKHLERWRIRNRTGWREAPDPKPNEGKYMYELEVLRPVAERFKARQKPSVQ